ncbi:bifunctional folylpolyglutamate synthase/dihydrofolate synthase [Caloranaerobacter azorensis]|uniref:Dihydrofolate synthase/folylpolyglutamate synthase n=1 Tax=Caloranaerobacter azorensis TaxID=116090 RepID=A0A6P1YD05_9FIRM|nr:folylpolyglutamate synthase/dihydrofolate synthase family protein [Caloranaerobacter azorensis]QIB26782.1 bifunctional folylpolyglutamate synthase/dihydrofolate synthase [Caloranaerobacter azorensis]
MNYKEALEYIHGTRKFGSKLGLENIRILLDLLGNPHKGLKIIHVAGTNGKGSTSSYISTILTESGYKVGLFTSPYLERFTERIKINGKEIEHERLAQITSKVKEKVEEMVRKGYNHPTEFEIVTAIAFVYYREERVDFVVLEVGLGGRYDSTNIIENPLVSVITPISLDHKDILGDTIEKIAWEKAGIIKENGLVVSHPQVEEAQKVIENVVNDKNSKLIIAPVEDVEVIECTELGSKFNFKFNGKTFENLKISLIGEHQINNACVALTVVLTLLENGHIDIDEDCIRKGLLRTEWKGRLEILRRNPTFVIDGAHNSAGAESLRKSIEKLFKYNRLILGIGILGDKEVGSILNELVPLADEIIITEANNPRKLEAEKLADIIKKFNKKYLIEKDVEKAVNKALDIAGKDDLILFSGSLYLIGDVRKIIMN